MLVCEMLLRKTRAENVEPRAKILLRRYPTARKLALARLADLENIIRPLGLFRLRSRALRKTAKTIVKEHRGCIPRTIDELIQLSHVGRYAANAVVCFAYGQRLPIVDANIVRLFRRQFGIDEPVEIHRADEIWSFAESFLPRMKFKEYNWALLDLGALICKPRNPLCNLCPVRIYCREHLRSRVQ
jgi:A/G-specific adenine glycosylase